MPTTPPSHSAASRARRRATAHWSRLPVTSTVASSRPRTMVSSGAMMAHLLVYSRLIMLRPGSGVRFTSGLRWSWMSTHCDYTVIRAGPRIGAHPGTMCAVDGIHLWVQPADRTLCGGIIWRHELCAGSERELTSQHLGIRTTCARRISYVKYDVGSVMRIRIFISRMGWARRSASTLGPGRSGPFTGHCASRLGDAASPQTDESHRFRLVQNSRPYPDHSSPVAAARTRVSTLR
jgi:hypothetical protein